MQESADMLRVFLAGRDAACPQCGYNVRDLQGHICPECGEALTIGVQLVEPRQAAPIVGLIGLSAGAGFNGLLIIYMFTVIHRRGPDWWQFIRVLGCGFAVLGLLLLVWLRFWRWIRRQSTPLRWTMVALCWLATLVDLIWFSYTVK